jgi:hypothetical protein
VYSTNGEYHQYITKAPAQYWTGPATPGIDYIYSGIPGDPNQQVGVTPSYVITNQPPANGSWIEEATYDPSK